MKALIAMLTLMCLALCACHKDENKEPIADRALLPGNCVAMATHYAGSVVNSHPLAGDDRQAIAVNADTQSHPTDVIDVAICHGVVDCTNRPAEDCASVPFVWIDTATYVHDPAVACFDTIPSPHISYKTNAVELVNAAQDSYTTYSIDTTVCR